VHPVARAGVIAIDLNWRQLPDGGRRVAYWRDDSGAHESIDVTAGDVAQYEGDRGVRALRSVCDKQRDEFLPPFATWLYAQPLPTEWEERISGRDVKRSLHHWRSNDRLASLIRWWAEHRLPEDDAMFADARTWRRQYLHLADWWRNLLDQMTLRLRERYRVWAVQIARTYGTVVLEAMDIRYVARTPAPETGESRAAGSTARHIVAPGEFRAALLNACQREGVRVMEVGAAGTSSACCEHGAAVLGEKHELTLTFACGCVRDRDENAARNILARASGGA
jgi:transposase